MSYNVNFDTVATSISGLIFTGIQVLDLDEIPVNAAMVCPVLFPRPDGYITGFSVTNDTYGSGTVKKVTLKYNLHYIYAHAPIGAKLNFGIYNGMVSNVAAIIAKFMESDAIAGVTDLAVQDISDFGPVSDPAGNVYHGCEIVLSIEQLGEV